MHSKICLTVQKYFTLKCSCINTKYANLHHFLNAQAWSVRGIRPEASYWASLVLLGARMLQLDVRGARTY